MSQKTVVRERLDRESVELLRLAEMGLLEAARRGAETAVVRCGAAARKRLVYKVDGYALADSVESRDLSMEVHHTKRKGSASTNRPSTDAMTWVADSCFDLAAQAPEDDDLVIASLDEGGEPSTFETGWHETPPALGMDDLRGIAEVYLAELRTDSRIMIESIEVTTGSGWGAVVNSAGVCNADFESLVGVSVMAAPRDGDKVGSFDYAGDGWGTPEELEAALLPRVRTMKDSLLGSLNPVRCESYRGPVILSPEAALEFIAGLVGVHASGRNVADQVSRWTNAVGTLVLSPALTLRDEVHWWDYRGAGHFDGDGVRTKPITVVDKGVLQTHLHGCRSARRLGARSTGHPGGSPHVPHLLPGSTSFAEMVRARSEILVVERFSGNMDPVSGDFSGVAKGSWLYRNGERVGVVTETLIAGQLFDLVQQVLAVGDTGRRVYGSAIAPYVLVDGVSVTGS